MVSRFGAATISHFVCFKKGYTEEEIKHTGLAQPCDDEKYQIMLSRDPYKAIKNKIETNLTLSSAQGEYA